MIAAHCDRWGLGIGLELALDDVEDVLDGVLGAPRPP